MKKIVVIFIILLALVSCKGIEKSLYEPVDKKDKTPVEIEIKKGSNWTETSKLLFDKGLISTKFVVKDFLKKNEKYQILQVGKHTLSKSMSLEEIVKKLSREKVEKKAVRVTIPEGYEIKQIGAVLEEKKVVKAKDFFDTLTKHDFSKKYSFLKGIDKSTRLEGFLFPDTYDFYINEDPVVVIEKMLDRFNQIFTDKYKARAKELKMSINQVITLASIVEREARKKEEFVTIAGVFHNRLKKDQKLEACSTVQFVIGERKPVLSYADTQIDSAFNTYKHKGLPPSPIAAVGKRSIEATLYPQKHDYLYFVTTGKKDGSHHFAKTFSEHNQNIKKSEEYEKQNKKK